MALSVVSKVQHSKRLRKWWEKVIIIVFNDVSNLFFVFVFVCMWVWSVFLMLDEEYNLLKKITDNFKRPKQTFFLFLKTPFTSKSRPTVRKKPLVPNTYHFTSSCWMTGCFSPHGLLENLENSRHLIQGPAKKQLWKALVYKLGMGARMVLKSADDSQQGCNFFLFFLRRVEEVYEK